MSKGGLFADYLESAQKAKQKKAYDQSQDKKNPIMNILKQGSWQASQKQLIAQTIQLACDYFPADLQQQANFLQYHLQNHLGKRIQIFIFHFNSHEGHSLYAVDGKFIEILYTQHIYVIWKVKLIEDATNQRDY